MRKYFFFFGLVSLHRGYIFFIQKFLALKCGEHIGSDVEVSWMCSWVSLVLELGSSLL